MMQRITNLNLEQEIGLKYMMNHEEIIMMMMMMMMKRITLMMIITLNSKHQ